MDLPTTLKAGMTLVIMVGTGIVADGTTYDMRMTGAQTYPTGEVGANIITMMTMTTINPVWPISSWRIEP
jgi:hypothetical protein